MTTRAYSLPSDQRQAVIAGIRKETTKDGQLEKLPDDLLLIALHALTGRHADMMRHVTAASYFGRLS